MRRPLVALILTGLLLSGCSGAPSASPAASNGSGSSIAADGPTYPPATDPSASEPPVSFPPCLDDPTELHQAPELEAQLPDVVGDRELSRWSVRARCALDLVFGDVPGGVDQLMADIDAAAGHPLDIEHVVYAVAGRMDTKHDPPYFVNAVARPTDEDEIDLNLLILFGAGGFQDVAAAFELEGFKAKTIGGKDPVFVGTDEMLSQNTHQRGRPYLYQTDDTIFLVITDDDAWAEEALRKLP